MKNFQWKLICFMIIVRKWRWKFCINLKLNKKVSHTTILLLATHNHGIARDMAKNKKFNLKFAEDSAAAVAVRKSFNNN